MIASPNLDRMEKELSERLIREMWDRRQSDVHVAHILFKLRKNPGQKEIEDAKKRADQIKAKIEAGESFEGLAKEYSEDNNSAVNGGSLGYITAWLPSGFYMLENAAYTLKVGEVSEPIVTKLGVHLVKVLDVRPAYGKIEVAHILMRKPDKPEGKNIKAKIDLLYKLLLEGNKFEAVAEEFSEDATSSGNGGKLKPFGINTFERAFEEAAFSLEKDGDISQPVETRIGWHIIKRISKPEEKFEDFRKRMKPQLDKMDRYEYIQKKLVEEIKEETKYQVNEGLLNTFADNVDSTFLTYKWRVPNDLVDEELMNLGPDFKYSLRDFAQYARLNARMRMRYNREKTPVQAVKAIYDSFVNEKAMLYEVKNLERKYPDFKALMREYEEGILLFEVSKMEVWDKASQDTSGLKKYYNENKEDYYAPVKAQIATYRFTPDQKGFVRNVYKHAKNHSPEETSEKYNQKLTSVEIEISEATEGDKNSGLVNFAQNMLGEIIYNDDGSVIFNKILNILPKQYRSLEESKGYVIADYQQFLEEKWIRTLKKEYNVEYKNDILNALVK